MDTEEERKLDANGNPSVPFDVSSKVSELLSQSSDRIVFLFFCPQLNKYSLDQYAEKLDELKKSVLLSGGLGEVSACIVFYQSNPDADRRGAKFLYKTKTEQFIDDQCCYVYNVDGLKMRRLYQKFNRQFKAEELTVGFYKLDLIDNDKCYQDIPHRITAYSRAVRELVDPDYSQEERNRMTEEKLNYLNDEMRDLENEMRSLIKLSSDTTELKRKAMHTELLNVDFAQRDYLLSGFRFNLALNTELGGKTGPEDGKSAEIVKNSALGYAFRIGQRMNDCFWLELGWNAVMQTTIVGADSAYTGITATDAFGTYYMQNRYLRSAKETVTIRRNTIPLTVSYVLPLKNSALALEAFAGVGITMVSSVSSQFKEGTVDVRASYNGFSTEIANVPALGLVDDQAVSSDIGLHNSKNAFCQTIGIRGTYKLIGGTSLCGSFGYTNSSGLIESNDSSSGYSLLSDLKIVKQNPLNISIGLSHCFKYEKK